LAARLNSAAPAGTGAVGTSDRTLLAPTAATPAAAAHTVTADAAGGTAGTVSPAVAPAPKRRALPVVVAVVAVAAGAGTAFPPREKRSSETPPPSAAQMTVSAAALGSVSPTNSLKGCPEGMVPIRGGNMFMGEKGLSNAGPPHRVTVKPFCLD